MLFLAYLADFGKKDKRKGFNSKYFNTEDAYNINDSVGLSDSYEISLSEGLASSNSFKSSRSSNRSDYTREVAKKVGNPVNLNYAWQYKRSDRDGGQWV